MLLHQINVESNHAYILSLEMFKKLLPSGWFFSFSVPASPADDEPTAVSFIVPMQDEPNPPIFQVTMAEGTTGNEYRYIATQAWTTGVYGTLKEALEATFEFVGNGHYTIPEPMRIARDGGDEAVRRYIDEVAELHRMYEVVGPAELEIDSLSWLRAKIRM